MVALALASSYLGLSRLLSSDVSLFRATSLGAISVVSILLLVAVCWMMIMLIRRGWPMVVAGSDYVRFCGPFELNGKRVERLRLDPGEAPKVSWAPSFRDDLVRVTISNGHGSVSCDLPRPESPDALAAEIERSVAGRMR